MNRAGRCTRPAPRGFALVMVLWVLAGLTVVAVAVATSVRVSSEGLKSLRDRVAAEAQFLSTAARIQVLAATSATRRIQYEGVRGALYADGRPLAVGPGEWVRVHDIRGLVDLNGRNTTRLEKLLPRCGAAESQVAGLMDALADYIDKDSLKRLNGAEAFEYRMAGLPEPRNLPLLSREELWRVKGWEPLKDAWIQAGCNELVTVNGENRFNTNTAPPAVLEANGLTPDAAAALVDARQAGLPTLALETGAGGSTDPFMSPGGSFVGQTLRIAHGAAPVKWQREYELRLTPLSEGGPWRILEIRHPVRDEAPPTPQAALPAADYVVPERERAPINVPPPFQTGN